MRILMIGAHPDDIEIRYGGIAVKYITLGHEVRFLSMTDGSAGHQTMSRNELAARRYLETQEVAKTLGIEYDVWNIPDGELFCDLTTRARLTRYIRKFNPDIIFCNRPNDYHADHRNTSLILQDAAYLLIVPNYCPDTDAMRMNPVIMHCCDKFKNPPFEPYIVIDISDVIEKKFEILNKHVSQVYEWLPYTYGTLDTVPSDNNERLAWLKGLSLCKDMSDGQIIENAVNYGRRFAMEAVDNRAGLIERYGIERGSRARYAESFALCEYGTQLNRMNVNTYFPF